MNSVSPCAKLPRVIMAPGLGPMACEGDNGMKSVSPCAKLPRVIMASRTRSSLQSSETAD